MKLTFVGAAHEVTGSCHFLQVAGKNVLVDCGMEQGRICMRIRDFRSVQQKWIMYSSHMHILIIPECCQSLQRMGLKGRFSLPMRQRICVISCFVTVRIFRNLRQSGEIEKAGEQESRSMNRFMRCRMHLMRLNCLCLSVWGAHYNL